MPVRLVDKESVGETPTGATETVALPGTQELSANRIGMQLVSGFAKLPVLQQLAA